MTDGFMLSDPAIPLSVVSSDDETLGRSASMRLSSSTESFDMPMLSVRRRTPLCRKKKPLLSSLVSKAATEEEPVRNPFAGGSKKSKLCRDFLAAEDERELSLSTSSSSSSSTTASSDDEDIVSFVSTVSARPLRSSFRIPRSSDEVAPSPKKIAFSFDADFAEVSSPTVSRRGKSTEGWVHALHLADEETD
eukprot:TRINITY_DN31352_c0_g1_i1.p1 TRINITY_DN31352_c0_g1~~TRINITY_DN31352_c0_g1_i1.p1  ORF type:complete len:192 (+),score=72.35 TRINITY_DN31352_c0_g1_i1:356-931(+)